MDVMQNVQIGNLPSSTESDLDALTREHAANKLEADRLTARNAEIAELLSAAATFKDGNNTGHLTAGGFRVTVTRKVNTRWDADKLETARRKLTDELFFKIFKWKYEPRSKKDLDAFLNLASSEFRSSILAAMETSPAKPGVKLEALQ